MTNLYHCLNKKPTGDALLVSCERELDQQLRGKFLFAATHLTKALAFAFSYHEGEVFANGSIEGTENEWIILFKSKKPLERERQITVLSFDDDGFIRLQEGSRQAVSRSEVPFTRTSVVLETSSYKDLMQKGLQVFIFDDVQDPESTKMENYFAGRSRISSAPNELISNGELIWVNLIEGINICPKLYENIFGTKSGAYPLDVRFTF